MPQTPEDKAREKIDQLLRDAGWQVQDRAETNLHADRGVAVREFPMKSGHGEADYLLFVDSVAAGVVEAKKVGDTLTGVEIQTEKYSEGLPDDLKEYRRPLPFLYQSTGEETRFTNLLEPSARSRPVFSFHRPETMAEWLENESKHPGTTLRANFRNMPELITEGLRPAQIDAIHGLEQSLSKNLPRALIQMASGGGKTFTACYLSYRLLKFAKAKRVLFLVDRRSLGQQAQDEFKAFRIPGDNRRFSELHTVQLLSSNTLSTSTEVCITTIQRLYSMLKGEPDFEPENEDVSLAEVSTAFKETLPVVYNAAIPPETFDFVFVDECHRSIYSVWRQVVEYFDAYLVGLTATPSKQTFGFFEQNLVSEYTHEQAVADGVNVGFDIYEIQTKITGSGSTVDAGFQVGKREKASRRKRWEILDEELIYDAQQLDRNVVAVDQIRTVLQTFRDRLFTEMFPGRREVPKTLIFAKDDSHADDIVQQVREVFGEGNEFARKITYRTGTARVPIKKKQPDGTEVTEFIYKSTGATPADLLQEFRTAYYPRIAVTVDMIATGTDVRPLEVVFFMRSPRSKNTFTQMWGRGTRVVSEAELRSVTPDAKTKDRFIIVYGVPVHEEAMKDTQPMERKRTVSFEKLLESVAFGNREEEMLSSLAARLARLERGMSKEDLAGVKELANGQHLKTIVRGIVDALDADNQHDAAVNETGKQEPSEKDVQNAAEKLLDAASKPLATNPKLRQRLMELKKAQEQTIDETSKDHVLSAGWSAEAAERARKMVQNFEQFLKENKNEITALQVLYSRPYKQRLSFKEIKDLADAISRPPRSLTPEALWRAYETLDKTKVRGSGGKILTDIVSLIRFALHQENELVPFREEVQQRFENWMIVQEENGKKFTPEQRQWLELVRDHIADSFTIEVEDFELVPFNQYGGLGKANQLFGAELNTMLNELNEVLVA